MDDMEEYTINDDLRACGLPGDDEDELASGGEALFGSSDAPINVEGGDDAGAAGGAGAETSPPVMPSSTPSASTGTSVRLKRVRSGAWNDFDEIFEDSPTGRKVRVAAKCLHCSHVLSARSAAGTRHLLRHQNVCVSKAKHASLIQPHLQYNSDGSRAGTISLMLLVESCVA